MLGCALAFPFAVSLLWMPLIHGAPLGRCVRQGPRNMHEKGGENYEVSDVSGSLLPSPLSLRVGVHQFPFGISWSRDGLANDL